ncbi:low temperature requirement protein A [Isoptericola sp. BMS4]|uniref:low temperature requirement protein A n=1 Tax=Isoptericola sp. BMS4 TaxID=2527875 RepID=UPI001F0DE302|nr:low temperature requirement protein A [Isoptericola sp. BMS4]
MTAPSPMLRTDERRGHVGPLELFFDLVYVFTIIQLSHYVVEHDTLTGLAQAAVLFLAVWWGWNYTAWAMNWLEPESRAVQGLVAVLMLAALAMAVAVPHAFDESAGLFVAAYLTLQLLRSAVMVAVFRGRTMGRNYAHLLAWSAAAGVLWVVGLLVPADWRLAVWALAVVVDYAAPRVGFWIPGRGTAPMSTWPVTESHLAERNRLVFIIALGESILVLGGTLLGGELTGPVVLAALVGFATIVLLWRLYFDHRYGNQEHELADDADPTAAARGAYAYAHALMVGGAILVAVGIETVVHHPGEHTDAMAAAAIAGGPALYLVGNLLFQRALWGRTPRSRVAGLAALAVVAAVAPLLPLIATAALVLAVLGALVVAGGRRA